MLSILVCHSYYLRLDQKQVMRAKPYPPLATLQVAELLRKSGHRVAFFDAMLAEGAVEYARMLESSRPQLVLFYEDNFNFLSKMCLGAMRLAACEMIGTARRAGARVIAAGPDVTDTPGAYLKAGADLALMGEGLSALLEVVPRLDANPGAANTDLVRSVPGIAWLGGGGVLGGAGARLPPIQNHVSPAAWDLVDIERYRDVWCRVHGYFSLNMAASRGCPFRCTWCAKPIWGNQYAQRSPAEVAAEMAYLKRTFHPDHIWFADDIFGFRVDWVTEFGAAVRAADAMIPYSIQTRADLVSERMARALRDSGCKEAWIGAESGSQRVLDAMNKGTTVAELLSACERLREFDVRVGLFIQLGYMDEQIDDIAATRDLLQTARPDEIGVSVSYPLPGTKFYELVKEQLGTKTRWQESDDLDMMFRGTYTSEFYRAVRDLLHDQVTLQAFDTSSTGARGSKAKRELDERWRDLLSREGHFRSRNQTAAAASWDATPVGSSAGQ